MMELRGEDGSIVELSETLPKELGRGPGVAPRDRSVSRRQVRLQMQPMVASSGHFRVDVSLDVVGPNPICVVQAQAADVEAKIVKPGAHVVLKIGDKFSLSIRDPVFYTLQERDTSVGRGAQRSNDSADGEKLLLLDQSDVDKGNGETDDQLGVDEEEGIAEAVARWQRRKQERLELEQRRSTQEGAGATTRKDYSGKDLRIGVERKQADEDVPQQALGDEPEQADGSRANGSDRDVAKSFGFVVEGSEFARYGKKGLNTSKWDWQIGRRPANESDVDEDEEEGQQQQQNRTAAGLKTNQKAKPRNEDDDDDDDDWRGDSEGEKELHSARKRPKKHVQTRSQNLASTSEITAGPRKKKKLVSTVEQGSDMERGNTKLPRQAPASTTKQISKRRLRADKDEEDDDDDDDDGEDLDGFLVDDAEEEDEEVADEEDEWTDEEDEEVEEEDEMEVEEEDEMDEDPAGAHAPGRPVMMDKGNGGDDKPLCKYGNQCFRKNKDHLAQFRH